MDWTASDYALVVSTTATALAALSGLAVPLWMNATDKRTKRREARYAKVAEAIYFCVENFEHLLKHRARERMRLAFINSTKSAPDADKEDIDLERDFERRLRATQLLAYETSVDFTEFERQYYAALSSVSTFSVVNGVLVEAEGSKERVKKRQEAVDNFVKEGAKLLDAFRKSFDLS